MMILDEESPTSASGLSVQGLRKSQKTPHYPRCLAVCEKGEAVALLGPNGSGKTTTFYAIAGLVQAEGGQVSINGQDISSLPMYRRARLGIGYLPQEMSVFRGLNVEQNIKAILDIAEPDIRKRREKLEKLLSEFSIGHLRHTLLWPYQRGTQACGDRPQPCGRAAVFAS